MPTSHPIHGLYAIIDDQHLGSFSPLELARLYLQGGARILQLRMKNTPYSEFSFWAHQIISLKKEFPFTFIINDAVLIAKESEADGVHLGQEDRTIAEAREILGEKFLIGKSTHSIPEALRAKEQGADYIACGSIFPSTSKTSGTQVVGLETLQKVVQSVSIPVVAIGGITQENIRDVMQTGVSAVAMISGLVCPQDTAKKITERIHCLVNL